MTNTPMAQALPTFKSLVEDWRTNSYKRLNEYEQNAHTFVPYLLPEIAVKFSIVQTLDILRNRLGNDLLQRCLDPSQTITSPVAHHNDSSWLKKSKMIGVNVRTIGSFWNVVNYAFTLPHFQNSVHLLPIWEPGVVASLYGKTSWNINPEFYNHELQRVVNHLDTIEKQLKVVVNLLHALGKNVGLDVIPHTDRFSEIVLTNPRLFEWVKRDGPHITDKSCTVYQQVEQVIWHFLKQFGTANHEYFDGEPNDLFDPDNENLTDDHKQAIIFGHKQDYSGRLQRRISLIKSLVAAGFETLPMTMGPPYRGLHINSEVFTTDEHGTRWYQYDFDVPQQMSRVFGPLVRYQFFHSKGNNQHWELDFDNPNTAAWKYFCRKYSECQSEYNFDFMRGDMAHVQMRPDGVPNQIPNCYDPLRAVKKYIQRRGAPHFAFYAETFLAPPNVMGYGDELDHLEAIEADATLGDLQATVFGSPLFVSRLADYNQMLHTRRFAPSFTVITADKDDPRFDEFYRTGNIARYFISLFLSNTPSYISLGFEVRNTHLTRGKNEEYSKLYVFRIHDEAETDKVTHGKYKWGQNAEQFVILTQINLFAEQIWADIAEQSVKWVLSPQLSSDLIAWTQEDNPQYLFIVNLNTTITIPIPDDLAFGECIFDTATGFSLKDMPAASARVYRF
jgi:hypothetical protein